MSYLNKIKTKLLERSNSYIYYKNNYEKYNTLHELNEKDLEHLKHMNYTLKKNLQQLNHENSKLLKILDNYNENKENIDYIKNQISKLNDMNGSVSLIPELNEKLDYMNGSVSLIPELNEKLDYMKNLISQIPKLNNYMNNFLSNQQNNSNLLNEIKTLLIEKNEIILRKNNDNYLFLEKNVQYINLKLEKIFDEFSLLNLNEFQNLNSNLNKINKNIISQNSKQLSEIINIINSNHMLMYSSLNNYVQESQSYITYLKDMDNNLNKINSQVNDEIGIMKKNHEDYSKNIEKLNSFILKNNENLDSFILKYKEDFKKYVLRYNEELTNYSIKYDDNIKDIINKLVLLDKKISNELNSYHYKQLFNQIDEIRYSLVFKDTIKNSKWFKSTSLSLNNSSSNYSFMYVLYRILNEIKPNNILEFGLGQTTIMTSKYVHKYNKNLLVIESNSEWINSFSNKLTQSDKINIQQVDTEEFKYKSTINSRYKSMKSYIKNNKFDLIIVDGPNGFDTKTGDLYKYSRSNIWDLLDNLHNDFIIVFDDYEREGEKNTVKHLCELLNLKDISFFLKTFKGSKEQAVICTTKYAFVSWF